MPANSELAYTLETSRKFLHMFVDDLTPVERLYRACLTANCADWMVGHLILTERMFHKRFGVVSPAVPEGFEQVFARDEIAPQSASYGETAHLMALFDEQRNVTIEAVRGMTDEQLAKPLETPHRMFTTLGEAASFCAMHVIVHAGQISMTRRVMGKPPII